MFANPVELTLAQNLGSGAASDIFLTPKTQVVVFAFHDIVAGSYQIQRYHPVEGAWQAVTDVSAVTADGQVGVLCAAGTYHRVLQTGSDTTANITASGEGLAINFVG